MTARELQKENKNRRELCNKRRLGFPSFADKHAIGKPQWILMKTVLKQNLHTRAQTEEQNLREAFQEDIWDDGEAYDPEGDLELAYLQSRYYSTENYLANAAIVNEALENPYEIFEEQAGTEYSMEYAPKQENEELLDVFQLSLKREYKYNQVTPHALDRSRLLLIVKVKRREIEDPNYAEELHLEFSCLQESLDRFRKLLETAMKRGDISWLSPAQRLILSWLSPLAFVIKKEQQRLNKRVCLTKDEDNLLRMEPAKLALITIQETLRLTVPKKEGVPYLNLCLEVGKAVQTQCNAEELEKLRKKVQSGTDSMELEHKSTQIATDTNGLQETVGSDTTNDDKNKSSFKLRLKKLNDLMKSSRNNKERNTYYINRYAYELRGSSAFWDKLCLLRVGSRLVDMLLKNVPTQDNVSGAKQKEQVSFIPAFWHKKVKQRGNKIQGLVGCRESVYEILSRDVSNPYANPMPRLRPMVVVPKPWTSPRNGGYLRIPSDLMRCEHSHKSQWNALKTADLSKVYEGLNALGKTPWQVNTAVLQVAEALWERGGDIAGLVSRAKVNSPDIDPQEYAALSPVERYRIRSQIEQTKKLSAERHALKCQTDITLQEARQFSKYRSFYLPHNLDFRGRAYPIPSTLHHMSSDLHRGLLTFASPGKPLGERGIFWLKVHIANLAGQDKLSFEDRVSWTENYVDRIIQVAKHPLDPENLEWWSSHDEPFQLLAACMEFTNACKQGISQMEQYECCLPIQQDGSCNGLQHYAALARDEEGAYQVNLLPCDNPQDVYSAVCDRVRTLVERDIKKGIKEAELAVHCLSRKVVKQTVMTSVYGVTLIGARLQIENRLKEGKLVDEKDVFKVSSYLANRTLESIGNLFEVADRTMEWLADCAQKIAQHKQAVSWITPLGLPIYQPYRSKARLDLKTAMQIVSMQLYDESLPVEKRKQRTAFPPNYVHSLDSSHMLMTASACWKEGMYFAAVHDSFWTSAADVDRMNQILRESFVRLHSNNLLWELFEYFCSRYPQIEFSPPPQRGNLDIRKVLDAPFFFD
eukprot:jgi/Galph1/218/GphlegSOOS_G4904.1